jgi:hypothetical protein
MENFNDPFEDLTSKWCEMRRPENLHFPTLYRQFNHTATSPPTAIKFPLKWESRRMKTSTTMANHDPRMNRTTPNYRALLGIVGTWCTSCDFCNCLLFALCVLDSVCSCFMCFLSVYCYLCACACFWPPGLKNPLVCKTQLGNLTKMCFPSHLFMLAQVAQEVKSETLILTSIIVDYNSPRKPYPRSSATIFATCFKLRKDPSTTSREKRTDPPGLQRTSRRQRLH